MGKVIRAGILRVLAALVLLGGCGMPGALAALRASFVPVGHAVAVARNVPAPGGGEAHIIFVAHAADGWHAFVGWEPCRSAASRCPALHFSVEGRAGAPDLLSEDALGTRFDLDGRCVSGPEWARALTPLPVKLSAGQVVVGR